MKKIDLKKIKVGIDRLVTMAEMGLGVERPLNREKRTWIKALTKNKTQKPILVAPIKDCLLYTSPSPRDS